MKKNRTKKYAINEILEKFKFIHGETYEYSKFVYINSTSKSIIICKKHGKFQMNAKAHIKGHGCKACQYLKLSSKYRSTCQSFIENAKKVHSDKYIYDKVNYVRSDSKVIIICKKHGEFEQSPCSHLRGSGCQKCGFVSISSSIKKTIFNEEYNNAFIEKANSVHNFKYDYSKTRCIKLSDKVAIICKVHGLFYPIASNHLRGNECKKCTIDRTRLGLEVFIKRAKIIHGEKYDYSLCNYVSNGTKVLIQCKTHNYCFKQTPHCHVDQRHGCPKCAKRHTVYTLNEFIVRAKKTHGDKYEYGKAKYITRDTKLIIICKKHSFEFLQTPANHINGNGCPKCNNSKGEKAIAIWMENNNIEYEPQKQFGNCTNPSTNRKFYFDFYITNLNLIIEYDGELHFVCFRGGTKEKNIKKLQETQIYDQIKTQYCLDNNIDLLRIPYTEFKNIDQILTDKIFNKIEPIFDYPELDFS